MTSAPINHSRFFSARARILFGCVAFVFGYVDWAQTLEPSQSTSNNTLADSLQPNASRPVGTPLNKSDVSDGGGKWVANKEVILAENGVTATAPATAHLPFPSTAGKIRIEADVSAKGTSFVGLALGRGDLTSNFWQNLGVMLVLWNDGRYNLFAAGKNQIDAPEKGVLRAGEANHAELLLDTVARTVTARLNGKTVLENAPLPAQAALDKISAAGFHFQEPVTAGQPLVSNFRVERTSLSASGLEPVDYAGSFVVPNEEATLRWRASDPGPKKEIPYAINDYWGKHMADGTVSKEADGTFRLQRVFPTGYAEIVFPESGQTFGIVSLKPHAGSADPFFCMDAGLTWLEQDPARRGGLVKIMARVGVAMARERFDTSFGPTPGSYTWEGGRKGDSMRKAYADSHVSILEILGSDNAKFGMAQGQPFPQNLPIVAAEWSGVARHFDNVWTGAEIYNESDLRTVPADQYVPMVKAFSYSLAAAQSRAPLVAGVFATAPPGPYFETCAANGMLADCDAVSFHAYDKAPDIGQMITRYREWLNKSNVETMPLWLTECGKAWVNGPARPPQDQDALSACEISAMGMEAMAGGIARYFPFVYVYYEEGAKNFGMMGREATPLRSMAAYAQSIAALSGKQYLGDLQGVPAPVKLARVFGADSSQDRVAVLYTGTLDASAAVSFPVPIQRVEGADGRELAVTDGKAPIPDGLSYVWIKGTDLGSLLSTNTPTASLCKIGRNPLQPKRLASPIVLQLLAQDLPARTSARRYLITQETARELPIHVRLHNLSPAPVNVTPELTLPGGSPEQKEPVSIPAMSFVDVAWKADATSKLDLAQTRFVTVTAKSDVDIQPSPLAVPLTMEGTLEQHLATHKKQVPLPITDLTKWQPNAAAGKSKFSIIGDSVWRMDSSFSSTRGNWTYPRFTLPARLDPAVEYGFLIRARVVTPGNPAIIAKTGVDGGGQSVSFWVPDIFPGDGNFHVAYIPFAEFKPGPGGAGNQNTRLDPASWKVIEIGMGSKGQENALEISHFLVVGGPGGE